MGISAVSEPKIVTGEAGFVLEDVPHLSDYIALLDVTILLSHPLSLYMEITFFFLTSVNILQDISNKS